MLSVSQKMKLILAFFVCLIFSLSRAHIDVKPAEPAEDEECAAETGKKYLVWGAQGEVGRVVVEALIYHHKEKHVRVVARSQEFADSWLGMDGVIIVKAYGDDRNKNLADGFVGLDGLVLVLSPTVQSQDVLGDANKTLTAIKTTISAAKVPRVVLVSSIGAHLPPQETGWVATSHYAEEELRTTKAALGFVRAAWSLEVFKPLAKHVAKAQGILPSFISPIGEKKHLVSNFDVGAAAAAMVLGKLWTGVRVIELSGAEIVSPNDVAEALTKALVQPVAAKEIAEKRYPEMLPKALGQNAREMWIKALKAFNSGEIKFEGEQTNARGDVIEFANGQSSLVETVGSWFE